jgi:hypothetical protein
MSDVIRKIYASRTQHNGYAVVSAGMSPLSSGVLLRPRNHYPICESGIQNNLDTRFDDVRYYAGDTAS